jgi:hypothetical protein
MLTTRPPKPLRPVEIHKQIVALYGDVMNRQNVTKWCREFSKGRTDVNTLRTGDANLRHLIFLH